MTEPAKRVPEVIRTNGTFVRVPGSKKDGLLVAKGRSSGRAGEGVVSEHVSIWGELSDVDHELSHVDVAGVRTRVLRAGSGPDLFLLHGTGGHLEAYARDITGLAKDFRVTAYDMVGHGWSDLPDHPYTIDVLSDHLVGLMDALGVERAHLSGESLGGWVVAWTAAYHPDRVDRLVLNTPGNIANKPEVMAKVRDTTLAAVLDPSDANVRPRVEFLFHHKEMVTDELVDLRRAVYGRPGFEQAIRNTLVLQDPEVRKDFAWEPAWVGKVTAPTLLLWTEHDPTGGIDEAAMLLEWLPDAHLHVIKDAGHWPQWEKVDEFLRVHRDFLLWKWIDHSARSEPSAPTPTNDVTEPARGRRG